MVYLEWPGCWGRAVVPAEGGVAHVTLTDNVQAAFYGAA